jgi:hypothetical protein
MLLLTSNLYEHLMQHANFSKCTQCKPEQNNYTHLATTNSQTDTIRVHSNPT